jgi:hypothetical protein
MTGVRLPSRVVRTDFLRGLLFVAAVMAVGVGYRGHGLHGAANSKKDSKFVDPFLAEDVAAPGDDEIPQIPEIEPAPDRKRISDPEFSTDPPLEMELESEPEARPTRHSETNVPVKVPAKSPVKLPAKSPVKSAAKSVPDSSELSLPELEPDTDAKPQSMPTVQAPRLPRAIKTTAPPKLDSDQDLLPENDLSLPGGGKNQPKLRALKNVPLWAVHGPDDNVIPVSESRTMIAGDGRNRPDART